MDDTPTGEKPRRWTDLVTRYGPNLFRVRDQHADLLEQDEGLKLAAEVVTSEPLMAAQTTTLVFLDGGIVFTEQFSPEDVDDDQLPTGVWVVGTSALRAVCEVLDLAPPGRLKIETQPIDAREAGRDLVQGRTVLDAAQQADLMYSRYGVAQLLQRSHPQIAEVPHHEWDCEDGHGSPALVEHTWRDGRTDSLPSFCWAQEIPVADALPAPEGPSDYMRSYYDEGADAEVTMHRLRDDVWLIVSGEVDERVGLRLPDPEYVSVRITAIRGSEHHAQVEWDTQWASRHADDE